MAAGNDDDRAVPRWVVRLWGWLVLLVVAAVVVVVVRAHGHATPATPLDPYDVRGMLAFVAAVDRAAAATKPVTHYRLHLDAAALRTADSVIRAEYLDRDCRSVNRLFRNEYTWKGVNVSPGVNCRFAVEDQRDEGDLWFVKGTLRVVHDGCDNVSEIGDKPTFRASECLVFEVVGNAGSTYPSETMQLVLHREQGRWVVLFEGPRVLTSDGGRSLWQRRLVR